ncbi:MAG: DNA repair protein RadA [bacterium]
MAKKSSVKFVCNECGSTHLKWQGRCPDCNSWGSVQEELVAGPSLGFRKPGGSVAAPTKVISLDADQELPPIFRTPVGISELDRVLGGGLVPGAFILLSGDPGIGKSTLLLEAVFEFAKQGKKILYSSGEESAGQILLRAQRLGHLHPNIFVANETNVDAISATLQAHKPDMLVVDSIQTVFSPDVPSAPGSVTQVRECAAKLLDVAKSQDLPVWLVGHVTKDGSIAGPRVLEHLVDCVLYLEGEPKSGYRILLTVKNRFGSTGEIGVFEMNGDGLRPVSDPGAQFLEHFSASGPRPSGVSATVAVEGTRPILVEIQSLVSKTAFGHPRRVVTGLDANRVAILLAVLEKRSGLYLSLNDVYATVAGGLKISEPSADFAIAVAIASSLLDRPIGGRYCFVGELGLSGEIRGCPHLSIRITEAAKMGFERIYVPEASLKNDSARSVPGGKNIEIVPVRTVSNLEKLGLW